MKRMQILLLEWTESFGGSAPAWVTRIVNGDHSGELVRFLAGVQGADHSRAPDPDEALVEALANLPVDGDLASLFDNAAIDVLALADATSIEDHSDILIREAVLRLLRVLVRVPERFPMTVADVHRRVESDRYLTLPSSTSHDLGGEALHVVARSQTDGRFVPLWWRLCGLESAVPDHALIGLIGLRWAPQPENDLEMVLTEAFSRLALACARATDDELLSDTAARRILLTAARITIRARKDFDWSEIGTAVMTATTSSPLASTWVARAFGVEFGAMVVRKSGARYEDPVRARELARRLKDGDATAMPDAEAFLEHQRAEATRRGNMLPLVQSFCYFANAVVDHSPQLSIAWASEAATWQPHNPYTAVTWAKALRAAGEHVAATDLLLSRLHRLIEHSEVWVDAGARLADQGEQLAAAEVLLEATERFPFSAAAWSALSEHLVRTGQLDDAIGAFESGLEFHPQDFYLLPGHARALALAGRTADVEPALLRAEAVLGAHHPLMVRRRRETTTGDSTVPELPAFSVEWRSEVSSDALGTLARILRRAGARKLADGDSSTEAATQREPILAALKERRVFSLTATSELALSEGQHQVPGVTAPVRELVRVRNARSASDGASYDPYTFQSLTFDNARSGAGDQRMAPLHELSQLRAFGTLVDGKALDAIGIEALRTLRRQKALSSFPDNDSSRLTALTVGQRRSAWAGSVLGVLAMTEVAEENAAAVREALEEKGRQLDAIEEDAAISLLT
jgi:tetratricopeptide (TPR) repeat protein